MDADLKIFEIIMEYLPGVTAFTLSLFGYYLFKFFLLKKIQRISQQTTNDIDDFLYEVLKTFGFFFGIIISLIIGLNAQGVDVFEMAISKILLILVITYQSIRVIEKSLNYATKKLAQKHSATPVQGIKTIIYALIWIAGALSIFNIMGYNVNSIIAGLGIGGIAIALAAQNILGDVFSSFSIYFDKPFTVGDYILIGDIGGVVEKIGIKSTRIRSLRGEQIVMSNKEMTTKIIQNFGLLLRRRVLDEIGVAHETPNSKLKKFAEDFKKIIEKEDSNEFERCFFKSFGESALIFEISYYINLSDYQQYTQIKNRINLDMKEYFEKHNIHIPYPTRTLYMNQK